MLQQVGRSGNTTLGLVLPRTLATVQSDAQRLYPKLNFLAGGIEVGRFDHEDSDLLVSEVVDMAVELAGEGARAISLMGSFLSFYGDTAFLDDMQQRMEDATGVPCTTQCHGMLRALDALDMSRVVVVTTYSGMPNIRMAQMLMQHGVAVTGARALRLSGLNDAPALSREALVELCIQAWHDAEPAHGILLAGGGSITLDAIAEIESRLGVPVVSSSSAACWDVVGAAGLNRQATASFRLGQIA